VPEGVSWFQKQGGGDAERLENWGGDAEELLLDGWQYWNFYKPS